MINRFNISVQDQRASLAPKTEQTAEGWRATNFLLLLLVVAAGALIFGRVVGFPFLTWDDPVYVTSRSELHRMAQGDWSALWDLLSPATAWSGKFWEYFPTRDLSYAFDVWKGGLRPSSFHQTSLFLHLASSCLVMFLGRNLGLHSRFAAMAAALFVLHPLAVEPVAWVSARKDLLYVCFGLTALLCFQGANSAQRRGIAMGYWVGFAIFAAAATRPARDRAS